MPTFVEEDKQSQLIQWTAVKGPISTTVCPILAPNTCFSSQNEIILLLKHCLSELQKYLTRTDQVYFESMLPGKINCSVASVISLYLPELYHYCPYGHCHPEVSLNKRKNISFSDCILLMNWIFINGEWADGTGQARGEKEKAGNEGKV